MDLYVDSGLFSDATAEVSLFDRGQYDIQSLKYLFYGSLEKAFSNPWIKAVFPFHAHLSFIQLHIYYNKANFPNLMDSLKKIRLAWSTRKKRALKFRHILGKGLKVLWCFNVNPTAVSL